MDALEQLHDLAQGYRASGALRAALEVGLLGALDGRDGSVDELAAATGSAPRGLRILADLLAALGLLHKADGRYRVADRFAPLLHPSSPDYVGDAILLMTHPIFFAAWAHAADAVRAGGTVLAEHGLDPGHAFWLDFARSMGGIAHRGGRALAEALAADPPPRRILDVACGSGMVGVALVERLAPAAELVQLDWPNVLEVAREATARRLGPARPVRQLPGDALTIDLLGADRLGGYDLIVASHFLHHFDRATCVRFLGRAAAALAPGGRLAVQDLVADEERRAATGALLFAMTMLLWTPAGDAYTASELEGMLAEAGLAPVRRAAVPGAGASWIVAARAPRGGGG